MSMSMSMSISISIYLSIYIYIYKYIYIYIFFFFFWGGGVQGIILRGLLFSCLWAHKQNCAAMYYSKLFNAKKNIVTNTWDTVSIKARRKKDFWEKRNTSKMQC